MGKVHRLLNACNDPVFFTKTDVGIGSHIQYFGRTDPGSIWEVIGIKSYVRDEKTGLFKSSRLSYVRTLNDDITLRCVSDTPKTLRKRSLSFSSLSYSAIWRMVTL
jgi:hypothetical protein